MNLTHFQNIPVGQDFAFHLNGVRILCLRTHEVYISTLLNEDNLKLVNAVVLEGNGREYCRGGFFYKDNTSMVETFK